MAQMQLNCPRCRSGFRLQAENPSALASKMFKCPKCGYRAPFGQLIGGGQGNGAHPATHIAGGAPGAAPKTQFGAMPPLTGGMSPGGKTQVAGIPGAGKTQVAGAVGGMPLVTLTVMPGGRRLPLPQGVYTLGRDSSDSRATIKIAPDPYMSRMQARLEVMATPAGKLARVIGLSPTNPVLVNNRPTNQNFGVDLRNGDTLLLGMTKVVVNF